MKVNEGYRDSKASPIQSLLKAKEYSDVRDYPKKIAILRSLIQERPSEFYVDSREGNIIGITHRPTGFRIHMPYSAYPGQNSKEASDDLAVYTAAPPGSEALIKKHGLLSAKVLIDNPEVLAAVIASRRSSPYAMTSEEFVENVKERLQDSHRARSQRGPSVFFGMPDPDKITDKHPTRQFKSEMYRVNLGELLKDIPDTVVEGAELVPYRKDMSDEEYSKRKGPLTREQIEAYIKTPSKDLWKHYDEPEGKRYASDVPHAFIITPEGRIPSKYIEKMSAEARYMQVHEGYIDGYIHKEAAPGGGIGAGALTDALFSAIKKRIDYYRDNPKEVGDTLRKIEQDPRLRKAGDVLRKSPRMRTIRRALGRPFVSLKKPFGYDSSEIKKNFDNSVDKRGLLKTLAKVIKGERLWDADTPYEDLSNETKRRMLAQRAYFDLPVDESKMSEHFEVDKEDPKTWRYKKDDSYRKELDAEVKGKFHGYIPSSRYDYPPRPKEVQTKGDKEFVEGSAGYIGGYRATRDKGSDTARIVDRWDFENYRGGAGYRKDVPKTTQSGIGGYSNLPDEDWGARDSKGRAIEMEIERNWHLSKNIADILAGNPITMKQDIDISKKALPKVVQERMQ